MAVTGDFAEALTGLGFVHQGSTRRGGEQWSLEFNRFLTFTLSDLGDGLVFSWVFALGEYVIERGMQIGAGETSFQELYPQRDVRLTYDADAVRAEVTRTLRALAFDLGDPAL